MPPLALSAAVDEVGFNVFKLCCFGPGVGPRHLSDPSFAEMWRHTGDEAGITVVNARLGYTLGRVELAADLLNVFNSRDKEIEYFYASRLQGEPPEGIEDRHFKAVEPRQLRVSALVKF